MNPLTFCCLNLHAMFCTNRICLNLFFVVSSVTKEMALLLYGLSALTWFVVLLSQSADCFLPPR